MTRADTQWPWIIVVDSDGWCSICDANGRYISDASVEGTRDEFRALAAGLRSGDPVYFRRLSARLVNDTWKFCSPRNTMGRSAEMPRTLTAQLADIIDAAIGPVTTSTADPRQLPDIELANIRSSLAEVSADIDRGVRFAATLAELAVAASAAALLRTHVTSLFGHVAVLSAALEDLRGVLGPDPLTEAQRLRTVYEVAASWVDSGDVEDETVMRAVREYRAAKATP